MIVLIYVGDLIITRNHMTCVDVLEQNLEIRFKMSKLGALTFYIGIKFIHLSRGVLLLQRSYVLNLFERFDMKNYALKTTPMEKRITLHMNMKAKLANITKY